MDTVWLVLESAGLFVAGLAARFALLLLVIALMVAVVLPFVFAGEGVRRLWWRFSLQKVGGLWWHPQTYYSPAHAWLDERAGRVRVGVDDLAAHLLARPASLVLPVAGTHLHVGDPLIGVESGTDTVLMRSPIDGMVRRVNPRLLNRPEAISEDPYRAGWVVEIAPSDTRYRNLAHGAPAREWFEREAVRLSTALEHATGIAAADGGELVSPSKLLLNGPQRRELAREFLACSL